MTKAQDTTKASAAFIFVTLVIEAMGFGIVMPVLPDVIRKFISGESDVATMYGYFIAVYAALQFLFAPILGRLSDKYGRRPVLLLSLFGTGVDYVFMALAPTLGLLFVGRVIAGISGASFTVATAYLADVSDDSNRAKNFGLMGAGFGLGFILGPAVGGIVAGHGIMLPFLVAAGLNLLNFAFGFFILPESLPKSLRRDFVLKDLNPFKSLAILTSMKSITLLVFAFLMLQLAGQTHPSIWAIYAFACYGLATQGWMIYIVLGIGSIFWAAHPALQSLVSREIPPDKQGELQGALMSLTSLTAVVNPLIMTKIFAWTGVENAPVPIPGAPYYLAGFFGIIAFIAIWKWERTHAPTAAATPSSEAGLIH